MSRSFSREELNDKVLNPRLAREKAHVGAITASLVWNGHTDFDLHAHVKLASGGKEHIFFRNKAGTGGALDVDANAGNNVVDDPVENIYWDKPPAGKYDISVNNFRLSGSNDVFRVRLMLPKETLDYEGKLKPKETAKCFAFEVDEDGEITVGKLLASKITRKNSRNYLLAGSRAGSEAKAKGKARARTVRAKAKGKARARTVSTRARTVSARSRTVGARAKGKARARTVSARSSTVRARPVRPRTVRPRTVRAKAKGKARARTVRATKAMKRVMKKAMKRPMRKPMKRPMKKPVKSTVVAKGILARSKVLRGTFTKTRGGLTQDSLMRNCRGRIVSKKKVAMGKQRFGTIRPWVEAIKRARVEMGSVGFVTLKKGSAFYNKVREIYEKSKRAPAGKVPEAVQDKVAQNRAVREEVKPEEPVQKNVVQQEELVQEEVARGDFPAPRIEGV